MPTSESDSPDAIDRPRPSEVEPAQSDPASRPPTVREAAVLFARELAAAVARRTARSCTAELIGLSAESAADFHASLQGGSARLRVATARAAGGDAPLDMVLEIPPAPAFALVDAVLGGGKGAYVPDRPVNDTERRLLSRIVGEAAAALCRRLSAGETIWQPAAETDEPPAEPPRPGEALLIVRTELSVEPAGGVLRLAVPRAAFPAAGGGEREPRGENLVEIAVDAGDGGLRSEDLRDLAAGDILVTDLPPDGEVTVRVAGIAKFVGRLVASHGRRAVHVTRRADQPPEA
jgi:flagellar motor switch protein FliM